MRDARNCVNHISDKISRFCKGLICLSDLILYVPVNNFSVMSGQVLVLSKDKCVLFKDTIVTPLSLKPTAPQSRVKHTTTEPLWVEQREYCNFQEKQ